MSYQAIKDLVGYALRMGLIEEYDRPWAVNELLQAMGMDAWEEPAETHERPLEDILKELLDDAAARGRIEDDTTNRDLFDTELMGRLTPRPSEPMTKATGPVKSVWHQGAPSMSAAYTHRPRAFSSSRVEARLPTRATGRCSTAPAEALPTAQVRPTLRRLGMMTPWAPAQ